MEEIEVVRNQKRIGYPWSMLEDSQDLHQNDSWELEETALQ